MKREIFEAYVDAICQRFKITRKEFFTKNKQRDLVEARYMLFYLCKKRPMRICNIEEYMGEHKYSITHPNIIRGIRSMAHKIESDQDYANILHEIAAAAKV